MGFSTRDQGDETTTLDKVMGQGGHGLVPFLRQLRFILVLLVIVVVVGLIIKAVH